MTRKSIRSNARPHAWWNNHFWRDKKDKITRVGKINTHTYPPIKNVLFVLRLKHNLLHISQLCDNGYNVSFNKEGCVVQNTNKTLLFTDKRIGNLYKIKLGELSKQNVTSSLTLKENHWVWHKKLGYASLGLIPKLQKHDLMRGLPRFSYKDGFLF